MVVLCKVSVPVILVCLALIMSPGCSAPKIVDEVGIDEQGVDVSTLPPEEMIFRYMGTGEAGPLKALLKSDPSLVDVIEPDNGRTPLHVAARNGNKELVQILLDNGADPTVRDVNSETPADCARQEGHLDLDKMLREAAAAASGG